MKAWSILLWCNYENHGGSPVKIKEDEDDEGNEEHEDGIEVKLNFIWLKYLPTEASIRKSLETLIIGYIKMIQVEAEKENQTQDQLADFARSVITGQFSDHLLEVTEKIRSRFPPGSDRSKAIFPQLPGSHLKLDNPALFYAKTVMQILSAHQDIEEEIRTLRRNLFRILNTSEFASRNIIKNTRLLLLQFYYCVSNYY